MDAVDSKKKKTISAIQTLLDKGKAAQNLRYETRRTQNKCQEVINIILDYSHNIELPENVKGMMEDPEHTSECHAPLCYAAMLGDADIFSTVLDKGADVNAFCDQNDLSPYMLAVGLDHGKLMQLMKAKNVDFLAKFQQGSRAAVLSHIIRNTVICTEIRNNIIRFIVTRVRLPDTRHLTIALKNNDFELVCFLLLSVSIELKGAPIWSPIHFLAERSKKWLGNKDKLEELVRSLIEKGYDIDEKAPSNTPLHEAALNGSLDMVSVLISCGATVHVLGHCDTPLVHLVKRKRALVGFEEVDKPKIQLLLEHDPMVTDVDQDMRTQLHHIIMSDIMTLYDKYPHLELQKFAINGLIEKGADVNATCDFGFTPLMYLASYSPDEVSLVLTLIRNGSDINLKVSDPLRDAEVREWDDKWRSAFSLGLKYGRLKTALVLAKAGCDLQPGEEWMEMMEEDPEEYEPEIMVPMPDTIASFPFLWLQYEFLSSPATEQIINILQETIRLGMQNPKSLAILCRLEIVRTVHNDRKLDELPLPELMKAFLRFEDLERTYEEFFQAQLFKIY